MFDNISCQIVFGGSKVAKLKTLKYIDERSSSFDVAVPGFLVGKYRLK